MNVIRQLSAALFAVVMVTFAPAISAAGPDKIFTLTMSNVGVSGVLTATILNTSPGNSTINSTTISLAAASPWQIASATSSNGTAVVSGDFTSIAVTGMSPVKPNKSVVVTIQLKSGSATCGSSAAWTAEPHTGNSLSGDLFAFGPSQNPASLQSTSSCDGTLACGQPFSVTANVSGATRLASNKDGAPCVDVNYDFTDNINTLNSTLMQADTTLQPGASFQYTVTWKPVLYGSLTPPPVGQTKVAWYDANGVLTPVVPAQACLSSNPPAAYGTLTANIDASTTTIPIAAAPPPANTPITIDRERMVVLATSTAGAWKVQRGAGGTTAAPHSAYYTDNTTPKSVMSNPLPLDPVSGKQMQMCLIDEGWATVDPSKCGATSPSTACVQKSSTVFDLGDGYMIGN